MAKPTILMIGNYLSQPKHNRNIWNDLSERLAGAGWGVITTSRQENKVLRLLDMLQTILFKRKQYALAQIDVFSGAAFTFARSCAWLLRLLKKPYVLTLHGGGLPIFAANIPTGSKNCYQQPALSPHHLHFSRSPWLTFETTSSVFPIQCRSQAWVTENELISLLISFGSVLSTKFITPVWQ